MKERIKLLLYLSAVLLLTIIHSEIFYLALLLILIISDLSFFRRSFKRILFSFIVFNVVISLSYLLFTFFRSDIDTGYILLINLRVLTITCLTFFFASHTNLPLALSFSETFSYLFTLSYSQIQNYIRTYSDLKEAHASRIIVREKTHIKILIERVINLFFTKSLYNAKETSLAMRSRGFLDG